MDQSTVAAIAVGGVLATAVLYIAVARPIVRRIRWDAAWGNAERDNQDAMTARASATLHIVDMGEPYESVRAWDAELVLPHEPPPAVLYDVEAESA